MLRLFVRWLALQVRAGLIGVARAGCGDLAVALRRRQLQGGAVAGGVTAWLGSAALLGAAGAALQHGGEGGERGAGLAFAAGLAAASVGGAASTRLARRLLWPELQLTWGLSMLALFACFARSKGALLPPVGEQVFGPLWTRLYAVYALLALVAAAWGGGCALFCGVQRHEPRPLWRLEGFLALRAVCGRSGGRASPTAAVAVIGVALGVGALIAVTAVMSGYQHDIQGRILGTNAHLVVQKYGIDFTEADEVLARIGPLPGVAAAAPFAFNEAMIAAGGRSHGVLLKGIATHGARVTDFEAQRCGQVLGVGRGARCANAPFDAPASPRAFAAAGGEREIYLGLSLLQAMNVQVGHTVSVMTPSALVVSGQAAPRRERFVVAGAFSSGMHEFDSHLAYVSMPAAQRLFGLGEAVSGIEMRLCDPFQASAVSNAVLAELGHYPYRTLDWRALNGGIFTALMLQKVVMFLLLSFIVVVASFNIASTLLMGVMQRTGQIATLKSVGCQDVSILRAFMLEGLFIGACGCALGLALGLGTALLLARLHLPIAADVYMVGSLTLRLAPAEVGATLVLALVICQLAALLPALRAAGLSAMQLFAQER